MNPGLRASVTIDPKLGSELPMEGPSPETMRDLGILLAVIGVLTLALAFRSYRQHMKRVDRVDSERHRRSAPQRTRRSASPSDGNSPRRRRRRSRSNPTLAEVGGLPPKRTPVEDATRSPS